MDNNTHQLFAPTSRIARFLYTNRIWIIFFSIIAASGFYIGILLFGNDSLEVLVRLKAQKSSLISESQAIEAQNARLQKQIFELKGLKP